MWSIANITTRICHYCIVFFRLCQAVEMYCPIMTLGMLLVSCKCMYTYSINSPNVAQINLKYFNVEKKTASFV